MIEKRAVLRALTVIALAGLLPAGARAVGERRIVTFAEEDTVDFSRVFHLDPIEVEAHRLKIAEIVDRCIRREEAQQERIRAHNYTQTTRVVFMLGGHDAPPRKLMVEENTDRVYLRRNGRSASVPLVRDRYTIENGVRGPWEEDDEGGAQVGIEVDDLETLPFYLEDRDAYEFAIVGRDVLPDRLIYRIHMKPRSDFDIAAEGTIWVDTTEFQILREEFSFGDRVPFPVAVSGIGPVVRERERVGDEWVWKRLLVRVDLKLGWMRIVEKNVPDRIEFLVTFEDHELNDAAVAPPGNAVFEDAGR